MNDVLHTSLNVLTVLAVLFVPMLLGGYFARRLRMADHGWRIGLILLAFSASTYVLLVGWPPGVGIDLRGGLNLVYEVDPASKQTDQTVDMDKLVAAISRRVNASGLKEVTVRTHGQEQVEVVIPEAKGEEVDQIKHTISTTGSLEFRILANERDNKEIIQLARQDPSATKVTDSNGNLVARWVPIDPTRREEFSRGSLEGAQIAIRPGKTHSGEKTDEVLVIQDPENVTGQYLTRAYAAVDNNASPSVDFQFDVAGAQYFSALTGRNLPDTATDFSRKLGIILNNKLQSAPNLRAQISDRGQITGRFSSAEVDSLVNILNAGALPAALNPHPISEMYQGPQLGADTIKSSGYAMIIASILVPLFMLVYYRFAGLVADLALVLNMLVLVAVMILFKARFTLTGFAGLALTVGMAVDNNVLVFERLREELERGATLRMAIRNAFHRAGATIIDCNLTHLLASTVLYVIGTEQVKGFAVTLWLGCAISIFTSVFAAKVLFEIAEKRRWITELKMLHVIRHTKIDFMGWFPVCLAASIFVTVLGLVIVGFRGRAVLDIDFTGGVSVQAVFREPHEVNDVRKLLGHLPDVTVTDVHSADDRGEAGKAKEFVISTSDTNKAHVQSELVKAFGKELKTNVLDFTEPKWVALAPPPKPAGEKPAGEKTPPAKPAPEEPAAAEKPGPTGPGAGKSEAPAPETAKPAPAQPAAAKPAEPKPAADKHSRNDLPPDSVLALADPVALPALPAADKPVAAAEQPTAAEKPAADSVARRVQSTLTFKEKVSHTAVSDMVEEALLALFGGEKQVVPAGMSFDITNQKWDAGSAQTFDNWDVAVTLPPEKAKQLFAAIQAKLTTVPYFSASNEIGSAVAGDTETKAVYALVTSWMLIILYLWIRFQRVAFGVAAVIALIHDVLVMLSGIAASYYLAPYLGFALVEPFKINLPIVAAFLTIIGYSVNDTIVVFDRIREVRGKDPSLTRKMVNDSTNQTLSRTLLTSFTVLLVVIVMYFWGGPALRGFSFALIIGVLTGTYSSIYVAAPILLWMIGAPGKDHKVEPV